MLSARTSNQFAEHDHSHLNMCLDIPAVLLVGGKGTRLRSVLPSTPKPLASVGDRSFLELLVRQLRWQGIRHVVMCTGYLADQIELEFKDGHTWGVAIAYSRESSPMGTAGAIKQAEDHLREASEFLVLNGDSFLEVDLARLIQFHREHQAVASIAAVSVNNASRYGTITVEVDGRVVCFTEKSGCEQPGLINGGVYVLSRSALGYFPEGPASLERDVFPLLLNRGLFAAEQNGIFIDIGTPNDYRTAQKIHDRLYAAAESRPRVNF
jgi:D-glycero-alpha-D-manno-heptose 1-phosphate guanylyltransferase